MRRRFIQVGRRWINPHYITSIEIEPKIRMMSRKPSTTEVHINLLVPSGDLGGNAIMMRGYFNGEQHTLEFESKKEADEWVDEIISGHQKAITVNEFILGDQKDPNHNST